MDRYLHTDDFIHTIPFCEFPWFKSNLVTTKNNRYGNTPCINSLTVMPLNLAMPAGMLIVALHISNFIISSPQIDSFEYHAYYRHWEIRLGHITWSKYYHHYATCAPAFRAGMLLMSSQVMPARSLITHHAFIIISELRCHYASTLALCASMIIS